MPVSLTIDGTINLPDSEIAKLKPFFTGTVGSPSDVVAGGTAPVYSKTPVDGAPCAQGRVWRRVTATDRYGRVISSTLQCMNA